MKSRSTRRGMVIVERPLRDAAGFELRNIPRETIAT
jgi:hypothetical protein